MPSLIPHYEYDIFISYRQNDNKSGWVTEFVKNLQEELSATIKEPVSVYFDSNPHDGLLETHNVNKSLEGKLKCLIFIPILSQTYCDPKSFAWEHEFIAFNMLSEKDVTGIHVKLIHGNVASRILPVKIHDLDEDDKALLESATGSPLRCIEFIFKNTGVNRPLRSMEENPSANLNRTIYRDQINKVANAVKEIVIAMRRSDSDPAKLKFVAASTPKPNNALKRKAALTGAALLILVVAAFAVYNFVIPHDDLIPTLEKSVAILPFRNLSGDPDQEYFSDGIAEEILNSLASIKDLKVPGRTSSFQFKGKDVDLKEIGEKLQVATVLEGSVRKQGNQVRITAQLIEVETGYRLWSEQFDRNLDDIFGIQEEIARTVTEMLRVTLLEHETIQLSATHTQNQGAYDSYLKGRYFWNRRDLLEGEKFFLQSIRQDSSFTLAYAGLAETYVLFAAYSMGYPHTFMKKAEQAANKAISLNASQAEAYGCLGYKNFIYDWDPSATIHYLEKAIELNPNYAAAHYWKVQYLLIYSADTVECNHEIEKAIAIDPLSPMPHYMNGQKLMSQDRFHAAIHSFKLAADFHSLNSFSKANIGYCLLALGKPDEAIKWFEEARSDRGRAALIYIYTNDGKKEKAESL
jgi:TolB-like protein